MRPGGPLDPESQLSPQSIDLQAERYLMTGDLPPLGMGGSGGARQRILNRAAQLAAAAGHSGGDLATQAANYRTSRAALQSQQTQLANLRSQEPTANLNLDALLHASEALPGQTEQPLVNRLVHSAQRNIGLVPGHQAVGGYDVAYDTAIGEYARLISMGSSGNGQLTDAARAEAESMIPYGSSPSQLREAIRQARIDMHNRVTSYEHTVAQTQAQLTGAPAPPAPALTSLDQGGDVGAAIPAAVGHQGGPVVGMGQPPNGGTPPTAPPNGGSPGGAAIAASVLPSSNDHSGDAIVFGGETPPPAPPPPSPGPIPGGAEFAGALQTAIRSGRFHNPAEAMAYAVQLNPSLARYIDQASLAAAVRNPHSAGVAVPLIPVPPDPRVAQQAAASAALEQQHRINVALNGDHPILDAAAGGVADTATLGLSDEITAGANSALGNGSYDQNALIERTRAAQDEQNHPWARLGGQVLGGAVTLPFTPETAVGRVAASGIYGAGYGFGSGEGNALQRLPGAVQGATIGVVAPPLMEAGGRVVGALGRRAAAFIPEAQTIAQAGAEEGVPLSRPLVDPTARDRMAYLESQPGSGNLVRQPLENTRAAIEDRAGQLGAGGTAEEPVTMGSRIQDAANRFIQRSRTVRDKLYDRAAQMAGGATVQGRDAVTEIDRQLAELGGNPNSNAGQISFLQGLRSDFVDDSGNLIPKTVSQIRDIRTGLRGRLNESGLTFSQAEGRVLQVLGQAKNDIARDLTTTAPQAVRAYARADQFNAQRASEIQQVLGRVIGPRDNPLSGERVWQNIQNMAGPRGNSGALDRLWTKLEPSERLDAAATLAESAGRRSPDEPFSPALFINFARSMSPAARQTIFGPEGARSIANLRVLSQALKDTTGRLNNSRSGVVGNWRQFFREIVGGSLPGALAGGYTGGIEGAAIGSAALGAGVTGVGVLARRMSARALMSPDMSRWLAAGAQKATPGAIRAHIDRLTDIAARDPAIAQEVLGLRQSLLGAVNDNAAQTGAAAASPDGGPNE